MADNHSVSSSKASSASARGRTATTFFSQTFPVFPFLYTMETDLPSSATSLGLFIQFVQMLAFVVNPRILHGESLTAISQILYASHLPFWDPQFVSSTTFSAYTILFWIDAGLIFLWVVSAFYHLARAGPNQAGSPLFMSWRVLLHLFSSILYIPMLQGLLSMMVCNRFAMLWTLPDTQCYHGISLVMLIVGIIAVVLLFFIGLIAQTSLFDQDPESWKLLSRAHVNLDVISLMWKTLSCILFHILLSKEDQGYWFSMYILFSASIFTAATVLLVPFYRQGTNRLVASSGLIIAVTGLLSYLSNVQDGAGVPYYTEDVEGFLFFGGFVVLFRLGCALADIRINPELLASLPSVVDADAPPPPRNFLVFPSGLPVFDLSSQENRDLVADIAEQSAADPTSNFFEDLPDPLLTPFITRIFFDTDVELATRFIRCASNLGGLYNKKPVLMLASRIFTKGLTRFNQNGKVIVALAHMISAFGEKQSLALMQAERIHRIECSFATRYHSYKLQVQLKVQLNVRDASYQKMCDQAKKLHKETLMLMNQFWLKLCVDQVDVAHLAALSTVITLKRHDGNKTFHQALEYRSNDRGLLTKYAGFLDQVMIEPEKAEMLRVVTKNEAEERRKNAMRGARSGASGHDQAISDVLSLVVQDSSSSHDDSKVANRLTIFAVLFFLLLTVAGFILFAILTTSARHKALNCVDHAGQARALAAQSVFLTLEYLSSPVRNTSLNYPILNAISATADDYLAMHNFITSGGEGGTTTASSTFLHSKQILMRNVISPTTAVIAPDTFWGAGFEIAQKLVSLVPTIAYYNNGSDGNTEYGTVSMSILSDTVIESSYWFGGALNSSVSTCVTSYEAVNSQSVIALSVLFAAFVVLAFTVIVLLSFSASQVHLFKQSILSLFPLIPRQVLEKMAQQSKERVDTYDEQEEEEDIAKSGRLHEDDLANSPNTLNSNNNYTANSPNSDAEEASVRQRLLPKSSGGQQDSSSSGKGSLLEDDDDSSHALIDRNVYGYALFLVILQVALLVVCAIAVATITDTIKQWNFAQQRFDKTTTAVRYHELALDGIDNFFQTAGSEAFQKAAVDLQLSTSSLADIMSLQPSEREIAFLQPCAQAAEVVRRTHLTLTSIFSGNTSNIITFDSLPASAPINTQGELARFQLFDPHGAAYNSRAAFASTVPSLQSVIRSDADSSNAGSGLVIAELAISAAVVTAFAIGVLALRSNAQFTSSPVRMLMPLSLCAVATVLALSIYLVVETSKLQNDRNQLLDNSAMAARITTSVNSMSRTARAFTQSGQRIFYNRFFDTGSELFIDVTGALTLDHDDDVPPTIFSSWFASNATAQQLFDSTVTELLQLQLIAVRLAVASYSVTPFVEVRNLTWNFDLEPDAEAIRVEYGREVLRYTNNSADLVLPPWQQMLASRYTVFSPRYDALLAVIQAVIDQHFLTLQSGIASSISSLGNTITAIDGVNMALSGLCLLATVIYFVTVFAHAVEMHQKGSRNAQAGGASATGGASSSSNSQNVLSIRFSLAALIAVVIIVFVVGMFGVTLNIDNAVNMNLATAREWHIGRALTASNRFMLNLTDTPFLTLQGMLIPILGDLQDTSLNLYFSKSGYNVFGSASDLDTFMFTPNQVLAAEYACGYTPAGSLSSIEILHKGASAAYSKFGRIVQDIIQTTTAADARLNILRLRRLAMPLLAAMRESSSLILKNQNTQIDAFLAGLLVVSVFLGILLIVTIAWVIVPVLSRLASEQAGSKLLLRLIPPSVRDSVPAIAEFLETEMQGEGQKGTSNENSNDSSTFPVVAIDSRGIVLKFNLAAEAIFGYTAAEVIGNNVSILMPDRIAKNHDSFLSAYRRTGVRHVIGYDRQVHAKQKSGELFPIELSIKEFKRDNGEFLFFGFIKDITKNLELKRTEELNNLVQEYATVPMIAIDSLGTVLRFNKAAEECFGQPSADVVNHNIKMLMPEDVAARHDSYLAAYLRTREKHVIDSTRRVFGLRKSGETFPLEINVKEITTSDFGAMSTYLGFCRDLTADLILDEANRINDEVADLSPIPIIGIDPYGKVLKFSAAACRVFGYEAVEVLDKNIKMLMPESTAELHDGYLEAFRHTGKKKVVGTERELIGKRKDGVLIPFMSNIREVRKEGQALGTFVGYFVDLSETKKNAVFKALDDAIVELHQTPLLSMDAQGTIQRVNKALLQEFGYRREELLDKNVRLLMPQEIAAKHDSYLQRYAETRVANVIGQTRRMSAKRKIGTLFPVELKIDEVIDGDGKSSFIGFLRNLSEELHTESQYVINTTIMEISITPMIGMDYAGIIRVFSKAAEESWKRKAETVIGQNVKLLMPDYYAKNHDMFLEKYRKTRVKNIIDTVKLAEGIDANGRIFPVELAVREIVQPGGSSDSFFVAYCRDMTKDGQAQQVIRRNDQISDLSPLPLLQIDLYGVVLQYNSAAQAEFQWRKDEVVGRNIKMLLPDEIAKNHDNYLATYRKTKVKNVIGNLRRSRGKRKDGSTFAVEISVNEVLVEGDGERNTYIGYIRDITEELRLIKANEVSGVISDLSPNPLVAINSKGIIISFNRAAAEAFRFADQGQALNQNVKILMPDEIAVRHDGFLTAYAKTKQKHVVDTTRAVKGKRQDGTCFPVEISVREINKEGKEATFLSYIRDCTEDLQIEHATKVSEAVQTLSSVPMITIDRVGKIVRVNRAAPVLFGFADESDMLGKNVKCLMPAEIAVNHDRYLSSYLQTGIKKIIDSTRAIRAKRVDNTEFHAEISVREIKIDAKESLYIGYLQDISSKLELNRLRVINDAICLGSPVPLIVIDPVGSIKLFSPAAEEFFGYQLSEVVDRNIKMLMDESVARNHDGYLANYLKTKVKNVIDSSKVVQVRVKTGELVTAELTIKELPAKDGQVNYVGYVQDMRSQYGVERALTMTSALREMMTLAIICMDEIGTLRQFNRAASALFGYTREEVIGNNVKMLMPAEVAAVHDGYLERYQRTRVKHVVDSSRNVTGVTKDGRQVHVELQVSEFMENGKSVFVAYAVDRTAELQLSQSAQIADALVSLSAVPIVVINAQNKIQRFNITAEKQFGWSASEVIGQNVKILMPDDVAVKHDAYVSRYRNSGGGPSSVVDKRIEVVAKRKDGSTYPAELTVKEVAKLGRESSFVGYLRDISEDLVFRSNAIMCSAIEGLVPDPIIVINEQGMVQTFTPPACDVFGYSKEEVLGQNVKMLMPIDIATVHDGYLKKYLTTGIRHVVGTTRRVNGRKKNGQLIEVELRIRELTAGSAKYYVGYVRDCTKDYMLTMETEVGGAIMELNPDAIITIDTKGTVQKFNATAEKLFDFDRKHIIGRNVKVLMPDSIATRHDQYLAAYLKSKVQRVINGTRTVTAEKKNGETFACDISVREVCDDAGEPMFYIGYLREVKK